MISGKKFTFSFRIFPLPPPLALVLSIVKMRPETPRFRCWTYNETKFKHIVNSLYNVHLWDLHRVRPREMTTDSEKIIIPMRTKVCIMWWKGSYQFVENWMEWSSCNGKGEDINMCQRIYQVFLWLQWNPASWPPRLLPPLFFGYLAKTAIHFLVKKTLFHTAIFFRGSNVITGELPTFLDQSSNSSCVFSFCLKLSPSAFSLCPSTWFSHPLPRTSSTRRM